MCLFPIKNKNTNSKAYKNGITSYECGSCPECLSKKSRYWALRCSMQAKISQGMMITLTYDTYKRDINGNIIGEVDPNPNLPLVKAHVQRFIKRLRYYYPNNKLLYIATGERGKRTKRAHYHLVLFGLVFEDLRFYKKSKRGNVIYKSRTLEKIWKADKEHNGGICTVDSANINGAIARYCTKYCAKDSGMDDTFMLFSHGIGERALRSKFNGKPYIIDGRQYPVPKTVWKWYIESKYQEHIKRYGFQKIEDDKKVSEINISKYYNPPIQHPIVEQYLLSKNDPSKTLLAEVRRYERWKQRNELYYALRDNDPIYKHYIKMMRAQSEYNEKYKKTEKERILDLDNSKYFTYKQACLRAFNGLARNSITPPPRYKGLALLRDVYRANEMTDKNGRILGEIQNNVINFVKKIKNRYNIDLYLPCFPCHNTANDRKKATETYFFKKYTVRCKKRDIYLIERPWKIGESNPFL